MSGTNIITANFARNKRQSITRKLYQGDYGQILRLKGIELPETFQAHFSNDKIIGTAKKVLGSNNEVTIPDEYLKSGTDIYVWVIIHSDAQDGETRYAITIPVIARPEATDIQPTPVQQDLITTAVAALNHALEKTEENVKHYPKIVSGYWFVYNAELDEYVNTNVDAHGIKGDTGNGISSAILNNDDTLTLTFTNGETYTTPSIKGRTPNITANREENTTSIYTDGYLIGHIYDGYSPSATVTKNNSTATISITDVNGTTTAQINDGATGATPNLTIGQISTLDPSESATATITGTNENPILNLGIPQGIKGNDGKIFYGTSNTSWNYSKKAVICPEVTELYPGLIIAVTFTNPGGPQRTMLNVNSLGDKGIYIDGVRAGDFDNNSFAWAAGATINFMYNGEGFNVISSPSAYYAVCSTASKTTQKLVYCPHSMVRKGTSIIIKFTYINTSSAAQLCVTEEEYGELAYLNGNPVSSSNTWKAGDTVTFVFDGLYWQGSTGPKGDKGDQGDNYVLTEQDKSDIANLVPPLLDIHEVPSGGTAGQVLKKTSASDYDAEWSDESDAVTDVQINGSSIVTNGIAEMPVAGNGTFGVTTALTDRGTTIVNGKIGIYAATNDNVKSGSTSNRPLAPSTQHLAAFYGLAKAAGDSTQSTSSNAVGTYTAEAKTAIQNMLDVPSKADVAAIQTMSIHICTAQEYDSTTRVPTIQLPDAKTFYLVPTADGSSPDLFTEWVYVNNAWEMFGSASIDLSGYLTDVTVNGTSVVQDGVAEIPIANSTQAGVTKLSNTFGLYAASGSYADFARVYKASSENIKTANNSNECTYRPIVPNNQHEAAFYGLAKASGDSTQSASSNAVGQYTDEAKASIKNMLGVEDPVVDDVTINGTSIVNNGIAEIPVASSNTAGIVKTSNSIGITQDGAIGVIPSTTAMIKEGVNNQQGITPGRQHGSVFYGLAKAAGDTTQAQSNNAIGTYTDEAKSAIRNMLDVPASSDIPEIPVTDVQINSASILDNSIANIPIASTNQYGVIKADPMLGVYVDDGYLKIQRAVAAALKAGTDQYRPIVPQTQHWATFYGLAKAAGDSTQASSNNAVGTYTDDAKSAIRTMLGVGSVEIQIPAAYNIAFVEDTLPEPSATYATNPTSYLLCTSDMKIYSVYIDVDPEDSTSTYLWDLNYTLVATPETSKDYYIDHNHFRYNGMTFERISTDVQINGSSIVTDGVAEIPIASTSRLGLVKPNSMGVYVNDAGEMSVTKATSAQLKAGTGSYNAIVPVIQHESAFYALAKAAGDTTQSHSSNAVGNYTDSAKVAIQKMLGIYEAPWELIREDTFTNETGANHIISVDGNGDAFELTDAIIFFETPTQSTDSAKGSYGQMQFIHNNNYPVTVECGSWTQAANTPSHGCAAILERKSNLLIIATALRNATSSNGMSQQIRYGYGLISGINGIYPNPLYPNDYTVTEIKILTVTGTGHYRLYGKRKWN